MALVCSLTQFACAQPRIATPSSITTTQPSDSGAIVITEDNKTLDLHDGRIESTFDKTHPDLFTGRAIVVRNARNVTIKNAKISGFKIAIYTENCPNLTIENCDVSNNYRQRLKSTPEKEDESDWLYGHENDNDEWLRYGGGIFLKNCDNATIKNCRARNGQNGICLVRCNNATVVGNDMSFMSGWGLAMWRSSQCKIIGNRFDYCVRGYSHGIYARGQDSTGILVYEQCSDNIFAYNHATHGGDGFFLYAGNETVNKTGEGGCNRNLVYQNDFSYAIANGIEATFSDQNIFVGNRLNNCEHGIWAGYSTRSVIAGNQIEGCRHGVSIEHGRGNLIHGNDFADCGEGIYLWWDEDTELLRSAYAKSKGADCRDEVISENRFARCKTGAKLVKTDHCSLHTNDFQGCEVILTAGGKEMSTTLWDGNKADGGNVKNLGPMPMTTNGCTGVTNLEGQFITIDMLPETPGEKRRTNWNAWLATDREHRWRDLQTKGLVQPIPVEVKVARPLAPLPSIPEGKQHLLITEWGPYDFSYPMLSPQRATVWNHSTIHVLGNGQPFKIDSLSAGVSATPMSGTTPADITLRAADPDSSVVPYDVSITFDSLVRESLLAPTPGGNPFPRLRATGTIWSAEWGNVYHTWDGSTDPRNGDEFFRRARSFNPPILREHSDRIDFRWGAGGPTPEVTDHFILVTTTTLKLTAGTWRLRTISDDGVRLYFDGKKVINNWTWHTPTEDTAAVTVTEGPHDVRIEYFEIDGNAQLQFFIDPVDALP
ncbi:MAG: right-handed parallel beta-helix repeat-containing protein [Planctomycetota bacterium]